jgi:hypothetical protein
MRVSLVSTLPFNIEEIKPGLHPSAYQISKAGRDGFSVTTIGDAVYLQFIPLSDGPPLRITVTGEKVAQSLIEDYFSASIAVNFSEQEDSEGKIFRALPGLFYLDGIVSKDRVKEMYQDKLIQARKNMEAWFVALINMTDDDWRRTHLHSSVSAQAREAASYMKADREWNYDLRKDMHSQCSSCASTVSPLAVVCPACKFILQPHKYHKEAYATV